MSRSAIVTIDDESDVHAARQRAMACARALGFGETAAHEVAIVTSELAWNALRHAGGGRVWLTPIDDHAHGLGIEIRAEDGGPPIADLALASLDGNTADGPIAPGTLFGRRGFGGGLGAVVRLSDRLEAQVIPGGKAMVATRFRARPKKG